MRDLFQEQLDDLFADLAAIGRRVERAVSTANEALINGNGQLAESVIADDIHIDTARDAVEEKSFEILSLQSPVASDLRIIVAALRMVSELERMGDLAVHVAKIARLRLPDVAIPEALRDTMEEMSAVAEAMVGRVTLVIRDRDVSAALALARADEEMDALRRRSFTELFSQEWPDGVEAAVDMALLGRYFERIADHAVSVANRVVFVVTGEYPVIQAV